MTPEQIAASALAGMDNVSQMGKTMRDSKCKQRRRTAKPKIQFPTEPTVVQNVLKRKDVVNHSYKDFSNVPAEPSYEKPTSIEEMSFSEKVHDILSKEEYSKYICWAPHGRAFRIVVPKMLESHVCPKYFGHKRYSSFLRQLNNHGFKHITRGVDRNCYYHEVCSEIE
jgi:hypothetical protein